MTRQLRRKVRERAVERCEYCLLPVKFDAVPAQIEHIIAKKHGGADSFQNLALACAHCNAFKGTNVAGVDPKTRKIVAMFNPRRDAWARHFRWLGPSLIGTTARGRVTVDVLFINHPIKLAARRALMEEGLY